MQENKVFIFSVRDRVCAENTDLHSCPKYQTDSVQLLSVLCVELVL